MTNLTNLFQFCHYKKKFWSIDHGQFYNLLNFFIILTQLTKFVSFDIFLIKIFVSVLMILLKN